MSIRIIGGTEAGTDSPAAALYDSVTGWAFGPVFANAELADEFLIWLERNPETETIDARTMSATDLERHYRSWLESAPEPV